MKTAPELAKRIEEVIHSFCSESSEEPLYLKRLAEQHHLLPILIDWAGFWALRSDGEIFQVSTEFENTVQPETSERIRRTAIFRGAKKYRFLNPLVSARPFDAVDCHHCEGRGRIDLPGIEPDTIVCYCGGLGWLTAADVLADQGS